MDTIKKAEPAKAPEPATKKPSQAASLVALVQDQQSSGAELFHDQSGIAYATTDINGTLKTLPVRGKDYRNLLRRDLYRQDGRNASSQAIDDALGTIEGQALFDGQEAEVNLRIAGKADHSIYLDLGNDAWQSVEVTAEGWRVVSRANVKWRRTGGMRALPNPTQGGDWRKLFEIFPLPENEQILVIGWLLMALSPTGPYPILILQGEQGTGKSTLSRLLRGLIDPNMAPIRTAPRNEHDLVVAAQNGWIIAVDNLSGIQPWLSDGLCRLATGGGFSARALYSNEDEHIIEATRPIIINGIDDMAARPDLADRAVILNLEPIDKSKVRPERDLQAMYDKAQPGIMGSLLDAVSCAMKRLPQTHLAELPRMADFALWVSAAESVLWKPGTFMQVYNAARADAVAAGLEGSPVAQAVRSLMESRDKWTGTATNSLDALCDRVDDKTRHLKIWPKTARGLSNILRRLAPSLRADGLDIEFQHSHGRKIIITKTVQQDNVCISSSPSSHRPKPIQDKAYSGDATGTQGRNGDASEILSSRRKPLINNSLGRRDAGDAKIQAESCSSDSVPFDDPVPADPARVSVSI